MSDDYIHFLRSKFLNDFTEAVTEFTEIPLDDGLKEIHIILQKNPICPSVNTKSLKDCLFHLHDMLAECVLMAEKNRQRSKTTGKKILSSSNRAKELWSLLRARFKLNDIKRKLIEILQAAAAAEREITSSILVVKPEAFQFVHESEIHGLNGQINHIQNLLIETKKLAIVGMGGSGKTVLARSVFLSQKMQHHFELRLWIDLSEAMDSQKKYFCILVERFGYIKSPCQYGLDEVLSTLYSYIRNRKCLIVLDGMWHYKKEIKDFIDVIISSFQGAVIVISRLLDLAIGLVGEEKLHMIQPPDKEAIWSIFKDSISRKKLPNHNRGVEEESWYEFKVSITEKLSNQPEEEDPFQKLQEEIKYRCDGVPLAAKTLAEIMWSLSLKRRIGPENVLKKILLRVNVHDRLSLSKAWYRLLRVPGVDVERTLYYKNEFLVTLTASCRPHDITMELGKFCHIEIVAEYEDSPDFALVE